MAQRGLLLELNSLRTSPRRKFWDLARDAEEDIFTEQLADVAQLRLEAQQQVYEDPRRAADVSWGLSRGHAAVKSDPHFDRGVVLELHCRTTVPFSLEVAARAYWRMFCTEHGELQGADSAVKVVVRLDVTDTTTRSFTLRLEFEGLVSDTSGKYTCQKSVSADEVEIAWVEHADVMEFGGVKFNGMQYQKRAFMKLRPVSREGLCQRSAATEVETHFETFPIFRDNVTDSWDQTLAFVNRAQQTHNKLDALVCQHMSNLLLEEDWKAAFG
ncbi:hypothetical protein ON010_g13090 [Phytophthora cinnamomi]|nr:hypothetical protein ON010_g13090 [Phytophthora cinnamomi]